MTKTTSIPEQVFREYEQGIAFKASLGKHGLYEQSRINERFFSGDQWHGVSCGEERPLVRHNIIKRIGDYKMSTVSSSPVSVNYSAEGVPNTVQLKNTVETLRGEMSRLSALDAERRMRELGSADEINLVMGALTDYFKTTAHRLQFDSIKDTALRNAYQSGTAVVYTYWDDTVRTGLYADISGKTPIRGDIACEVLDIENVYFGDPTVDDVQSQPYILISQRKSVGDLRREAKRHHRSAEEIAAIHSDRDAVYAGAGQSENEPEHLQKVTVITRLWKEWNDDTGEYVIKAVKTCRGAVIRPAWDIGIRLYPLAKFTWERHRNCAYGDSEITYLIPNQIAINRMMTASVWAVMVMGMPIMVVNGDIVTQPITNDPGQIIQVFGGNEDVDRAIRYVTPPSFSPQFDNMIASLIDNSLMQAGANNAALGDMNPDNTSAIIALREAATMPMQLIQNRFYGFIADIGRIWAEFWLNRYGNRLLKIEDEHGSWYLPFDSSRYRDLLISVRVDVGASGLWSELQSTQTLDNLLEREIISVEQYLTRLPKGAIPNLCGLIREMEANRSAAPTAAEV